MSQPEPTEGGGDSSEAVQGGVEKTLKPKSAAYGKSLSVYWAGRGLPRA